MILKENIKTTNKEYMGSTAYAYCPPAYGARRLGRIHDGPPSGGPVNIEENAQSFLLRVFAPGLTKENFAVSVKGDILYVRFQGEAPAFGGKFTRREYNPADLDRSFRMNGKVDVDKVQVSYRDGILTIELPRKEKPAG
jgi:HSP20 family protein